MAKKTVTTDVNQDTPAAEPEVIQEPVQDSTNDGPRVMASRLNDGIQVPDKNLRMLSFDEASNLAVALRALVEYQRGQAYRHDMENAIAQIAPYGFGYDVDRADADNLRVQEELLASEASGVSQAVSEGS